MCSGASGGERHWTRFGAKKMITQNEFLYNNKKKCIVACEEEGRAARKMASSLSK